MRQEQWDRMQEQLSEPWIPGTGQVPRKGKWDWSSKWYEVPKKGRDTLVSFSATMYRYRRNRFDEAVPDKVELRVKFDRTTHGRDSCKQVMDMLCAIFNRYTKIRPGQDIVDCRFCGAWRIRVNRGNGNLWWRLEENNVRRGDGQVIYIDGKCTAFKPFHD